MDAEAEHIVRLSQGDGPALRTLYDALARNVFALALQLVRTREDAEEVVQDTFVKVHAHAARFDPSRGSARAWVYTIARNEARMRLRARSSRPSADDTDPHDPTQELAAPSPGAEASDRLTVEQAFATIDPDDARLLHEAFFMGYSHSEIAEREGTPLGTVKSRLRRAMLRAREALTRNERAPEDVA